MEDTARCWTALRPRSNQATPTLRGPQGQEATTIEEKEALIRETAFPVAPEAGLAQLVQPGVMHQSVGVEQVRKAIFSQSVQKAPGVDKLNFRALRAPMGTRFPSYYSPSQTMLSPRHSSKGLESSPGNPTTEAKQAGLHSN
jgi:hypothetical protein